jgi:hypothetical protein
MFFIRTPLKEFFVQKLWVPSLVAHSSNQKTNNKKVARKALNVKHNIRIMVR